jgi:hypothetical protein
MKRPCSFRTVLVTATVLFAAVGAHAQSMRDASFRLVNRGTVTVTELFATPTGDPNWGRNRLPPGGVPAGAALLVRIPRAPAMEQACLYDLRVVFADHRALAKRRADLCRITDLPVP